MGRFKRIMELVEGPWRPLPQFVAAAAINRQELSDDEMAQRAFRLAAADHYLQANPETVVVGISKDKFAAGRTTKDTVLMVRENPQFDPERVTLGITTMSSLSINRPPTYRFKLSGWANARASLDVPMPSAIIMPDNLDSARHIAAYTEDQGILAVGASAVEAVFSVIDSRDSDPVQPNLALAVQIARPLLAMA